MADFPYLPIYTDAFVADTTHLSAQETGAYLLLLFAAWRAPDCSLPNDDIWLARTTRTDKRTWAKIKDAVMAFWSLADGRWTQKRLTKTRDLASKKANAARENGKRGGRPKSLENMGPGGADENPVGSHRVSKLEATKAITKTNVIPHPAAQAIADQPQHTTLDPAWELDQALIDAAIAEGLPREQVIYESLQFRDWYLEKGFTSLDWLATWRRWCRNPRQRRGSQPSGRSGHTHYDPPPTGQAAYAAELYAKSQMEEPDDRDATDPDILVVECDDDIPGGSRGEDLGVPWASGGGGRPSDQLLRAAGYGANDPRAAAANRRAKAARTGT